MTSINDRIGTQIALNVPTSSLNTQTDVMVPSTVAEILKLLEEGSAANLPMLRTACGILSVYLATAADRLTLQAVFEAKDSLRKHLASRRYAENSIRTYVNNVTILLNKARDFGWVPSENVPIEWKSALECASEQSIKKSLIKTLIAIRPTPLEVTSEDAARWAESKVKEGFSVAQTSRTISWLWQTLNRLGLNGTGGRHGPAAYQVPVREFPARLKSEVQELLRWKQAEFSPGRPSDGQHRPVTARALEGTLCRRYGYAVHYRKEAGIKCLSDLVKEETVTGFVGWRINERRNNGSGVRVGLGFLRAALRHHPVHRNIDLIWCDRLIESVPVEADSVRRARRAEKYLDYAALEPIPDRICQARSKLPKSSDKRPVMVMQELLMKWLLILPWRQRNIRECCVSGPEPNLFRSPILPGSEITKPSWVVEEEQRNPNAQFWQFRFRPTETKTGTPIHALLPKQLLPLLEEYLSLHRPHLLRESCCDTLFLNRRGGPIDGVTMSQLVRELTYRYAGRQVTPHRFRDIVAYAWLLDHPDDYLRLSKLLWHRNINTTLRIYGARFNESSGVAAMESWLEERQKGKK